MRKTFDNKGVDTECSLTKSFHYFSPSHAVAMLCTLHIHSDCPLHALDLAPTCTLLYILLVIV